MSKNYRLIEWLKTGLIALLAALAVFLGWQTRLFNDFFQSIPIFDALAGALRNTPSAAPPQSGIISNEAARPSAIVITDADGEHYGVKYDDGALGRAYARISTIFGEALGSAQPPTEIEESEWRASLGASGVYFEYHSPVRLDILAGWLGIKPPDGLDAYSPRRVCVSFSGENNTLYFEDGGAFYACGTAAPGGVPSGLVGYAASGARFAFETGGDSRAPYMLIFPGIEHPALQSDVTVSARESIDALLMALGVTGLLETSYITFDSELRYVGATFSVTASSGGRVTLRGTLSGDGIDIGDSGQLIERARVLATETAGKTSGDARLYFYALEYADQQVTVTFRYHAAGGIVYMYGDGHALSVTFTDGAISGIELIYRTVTVTGNTVRLMPERQTLAAAGGEFILCYHDSGGGYLRPAWVEAEGEA